MKSIVFTLLLFLLVPSMASAQASFDTAVEQGKSAYQTGDYTVAIEQFLAAYKTRPTPSLLYNIARSYDAKGDLEHAEEYYLRFIKAPGISQSARADAVDRLKTVRDIQALNAEDEKNKVEKTKQVETKIEKLEPAPVYASEEKSASPFAWILIGLGTTSLAGSVVTGLLSQTAYDRLKELGYPDEVTDLDEAKTKQEHGQLWKNTSMGLLAGGSALLLGGIITYYVTKPSSAEAQAWNIQPILSADNAGIQLITTW